MTIKEALTSLVQYPIPDANVEKIGVDRGLTLTEEYTTTIAESDAYRLAEADLFMYMFTAPDLKEQEISITPADRKNYKNRANRVYGELNDPAFSGRRYGLIGENYNG